MVTFVSHVREITEEKIASLRTSNHQRKPVQAPKLLNQSFPLANKSTFSNISTPIDVARLNIYLRGYQIEKANFLLDGFTFGFKIPFAGKIEPLFGLNLKSARDNIEALREIINDELKAGRAAGPFVDPPFYNFKISP